jgi:hypothetical protein
VKRARGTGLVTAATVTVLIGCGGAGDAEAPGPFWTYLGEGVEVEARVLPPLDARELSVGATGTLLTAGRELAMPASAIHRGEDEFIVLERQPPSVLVVDRGGSIMGTLGGPGDGPGELRDPSAVALTRDGEILVLDARHRALIVLSPGGEEVRRVPLPLADGPFAGFSLVGLDGLGGAIGVREEEMVFPIEDGFRYRPRLRVVRIAEEGEAETVLVEAPAAGRMVRELFPGQLASAPEPGGPDTRVTLSGPCKLFLFETGSRVLARFNFSVRLDRGGACDEGPEDAWILTTPAFLADFEAEGHVLVRIDPRTMSATDAVRLPPRASLLSIRGSEAIVVLRDELDVETVWSVELDETRGRR